MRSSTSPSISRRAFLGVAAGALGAAPLAGCVTAPVPEAARGPYNRILVDTGPMAATGAGELAARIRPLVGQAVTRALGGRVGVRGGPDVIVTVKSLQLAMYGGGGSFHDNMFPFGNDTMAQDWIDATVTVQRGTEIIDSFPVMTNQPASTGGPVIDPQSEWRRVLALVDALAYWIGKRLA